MRISTANKYIHRLRMRASQTSGQTNGFTLIEIMVVIFLIGIASAVVVLSLPGDAAQLRDQADRLAARIAAARDEAVLESRPMAVWLRPSGYGFEQRTEGSWQSAQGKSFGQTAWIKGTAVTLSSGKEARIVFDTTGLPSAPADIALKRGEAEAVIKISAAGDVAVAR
jgi:general secretion pathway protein H